MRTEKILVVDDDAAVRRLIWKALQSTGILIYQSESIEKTKDIVSRVTFDLFILDDNLEHDSDGYYLVQMIREKYPLVPIIFFSSKKEEEDIIAALEMGVDSYITKPFSLNVFKAQVIASLNRARMIRKQLNVYKKEELQVGDFRFDYGRYQLFKKDLPISLSSKEVQLIQFFLENPEQVFSKEQIYSSVWGTGDVDANTIMVFINRLRSKLEENRKNLVTFGPFGALVIPLRQMVAYKKNEKRPAVAQATAGLFCLFNLSTFHFFQNKLKRTI